MRENNLAGRQVVTNQPDKSNSNGEVVAAIKEMDGKLICQRCGSVCTNFLPRNIAYCRACIGLGRISQRDYLIRYQAQDKFAKKSYLTWDGRLTTAQKKVSRALSCSLMAKRFHLVHAVTGAGKTEMLFEPINQALKQGLRIVIATPRIDVVNELFPRFQKAFAELEIGKYHGREYLEPKNEQLTICTTHQLMKFYHAFDLIVIDEVDAFPYVDSRMLHFAAANALKKSGVTFYLTATPTIQQLDQVKRHELNYCLLKTRFHGGKLPVPKEILLIRKTIGKNKCLHEKILRTIKQVIDLNKPVLIFVPKIWQLPIYQEIIQQQFKKISIDTVYSGDPERLEKIAKFRSHKIDLLLTTTILERGVTIKHVQVLILDADDRIYNTASLVQIAGRVGRAKDDQNGNIIYFYHHYTDEIKRAVRQIKEMNRE